MQATTAEIARLLNGEVIGDGTLVLNKVAKIEEGTEGALSFLANPKYEQHIYQTLSSAILVSKTFVPTAPIQATLIKVDDPYAAFTQLLTHFSDTYSKLVGISDTAIIAHSVNLGEGVYVGEITVLADNVVIGNQSKIFPQVYIGSGVKIGKNCLIYPKVNIYHGCEIGDNCIIHSGTVIGSDGFGFAPQADKSYQKIPQTGNVIIENDVEIGANCSIDRATIGSTIIRRGVKLDNLVQVAHNVEIGEHTVIASQSGVAGSTKIGKYCIIAGQVGFVGHISIADGSIIGAQSGVSNSIKEANKKWFGTPASELSKSLKAHTLMRNLPDIELRIRELEKQMKELKSTNNQ
jgi:UDP-3-O-[3-hydroxymyristoyl] glucosamine N-acyltransferase